MSGPAPVVRSGSTSAGVGRGAAGRRRSRRARAGRRAPPRPRRPRPSAAGGRRRADRGDGAAQLAGEHAVDEVVAGREAAVHRRAADAGPLGDVLDAPAVRARARAAAPRRRRASPAAASSSARRRRRRGRSDRARCVSRRRATALPVASARTRVHASCARGCQRCENGHEAPGLADGQLERVELPLVGSRPRDVEPLAHDRGQPADGADAHRDLQRPGHRAAAEDRVEHAERPGQLEAHRPVEHLQHERDGLVHLEDLGADAVPLLLEARRGWAGPRGRSRRSAGTR